MNRIGIIGEIGSGKTFVGKCFKYPLFNADDEVIKIYKKNKECFDKLKKKFPNKIKKFPIIKSELRAILNKKNLIILSRIVHPYVRKSLKKFLNKNKNCRFVILDIPLLLENKLNKKSDILIYVKASKKKINQRLKKRESYSKNILNILRSQQFNKNKKKKSCNFVIDNSLDKKNTLKQIKYIKKEINA